MVLGVEICLALRRQYLPTDRPLELDRTFGPADGSTLRFVVLGDSTSAGLGVREPDAAYPTLLARRLAREMGRRVELTVLGVSGARVQDLLNEQAAQAAALRPDLVFIGIGANDVTHLTPLHHIRTSMSHTLEKLDHRGTTVVVAGAPDMRVLAWHEPLRSLAYLRGKQVAAAIEKVAQAKNIPVVDLDDETGHFFAEEPETHFSEDGFHPGARGYRRWADAIFPVLMGAMEQ